MPFRAARPNPNKPPKSPLRNPLPNNNLTFSEKIFRPFENYYIWAVRLPKHNI